MACLPLAMEFSQNYPLSSYEIASVLIVAVGVGVGVVVAVAEVATFAVVAVIATAAAAVVVVLCLAFYCNPADAIMIHKINVQSVHLYE